MKLNIKHLGLLFALITSAVLVPKQTSAQYDNVNFQVFYGALSPYGEWVDYQNYGYVWIPDVGADFVPYSTAGYWVSTQYGWTWVSDYEWGWAPFHYGRWNYDNYYGWLWVPDNQWGPSWVNWRRSEGYYGWSPMESGISLSLSFGRPFNYNNDHWMFVRDNDFERRDIFRYSVNRNDRALIIRNSTVINTTYIDNSRHTTYVTGPAREDVQRVTGRRISPVTIRENSRPGQALNNGQLSIYRPKVVMSSGNQRRPEPSRVANIRDVKRPSEREATVRPSNPLRQNIENRVQPAQQRSVTPARQPQPNGVRTQENNRVQPSQPQNQQRQAEQKQQQQQREQKAGQQRQADQVQQQLLQQEQKQAQQKQAEQNQQHQQKAAQEQQQRQQQAQPKPQQQQQAQPKPQQAQPQQRQQQAQPQQRQVQPQPQQQRQAQPPQQRQQQAQPQQSRRSEQPKESKDEKDKKKND